MYTIFSELNILPPFFMDETRWTSNPFIGLQNLADAFVAQNAST